MAKKDTSKWVHQREKIKEGLSLRDLQWSEKQKEFIAFVLSKYVESGVDELDQEKLPQLLINKYQSLEDAKDILGEVDAIQYPY